MRSGFYALHRKKGFPRLIADGMSVSFMHGVRVFGIKPPEDLTPLTIVSHKYKFIYIGIPKVATRSFKQYFLKNKKHYGIEIHESKAAYQSILRKYPGYFKFAFVRDPLARVLSCYQSKIGPPTLSLLKQARIMSFYEGLEPGMSFHDFARWLISQEGHDSCADRHWMSQYKFLYREDGTQICDFIGHYEYLEQDLKMLEKQLGLPEIKLELAGWISRGKKEVNSETAELIRQRYAWDYELLGYEEQKAKIRAAR